MGQVLSVCGSPGFFDLSLEQAACGDHETNSLGFSAFADGIAFAAVFVCPHWFTFHWATADTNPDGGYAFLHNSRIHHQFVTW